MLSSVETSITKCNVIVINNEKDFAMCKMVIFKKYHDLLELKNVLKLPEDVLLNVQYIHIQIQIQILHSQ